VINPKQEFRTFGEQLQAIARAADGHRDQRLVEQRAATGAGETIPSDGGFLVQQDFAAELFMRTYSIGELLTRVRRVPVGPLANGLKMNAINETSRATGSRYGGIQVYRTNEADALTPKKPKFRQMELNLKKLTGLCYATDELLQDSTALEAVINQAFPEEFSFQLEDEIMNGNGSGQMLGILSSGSLVTVAKEVGQDAATVVAENITKMYARMWARSLQNAVWFVNQDVFPTLYTMGLTVGTGGAPMFFPAGGFNNSPYNTLLGRPIIPVEYCQTVGAVGDIVFADLSQYLMIEKGGLQAAQSIHVRFLNDEQVYRFIMRNDGQPLWNQVLTPKNGTNTISPFIALAAR
jgi:HK97 family phage major capsid protein